MGLALHERSSTELIKGRGLSKALTPQTEQLVSDIKVQKDLEPGVRRLTIQART